MECGCLLSHAVESGMGSLQIPGCCCLYACFCCPYAAIGGVLAEELLPLGQQRLAHKRVQILHV